jgi:glutathione S-transferase
LKKIPQDKRDGLKTVLSNFEMFLEKSEWIAGNELSVADIAILANVGTIKVCSLLPQKLFFCYLEIIKIFIFQGVWSEFQ